MTKRRSRGNRSGGPEYQLGGALAKGFAALSPERRSELARRGGRAAHDMGVAHTWTSEEARKAGRKGGIASNGGRGRK